MARCNLLWRAEASVVLRRVPRAKEEFYKPLQTSAAPRKVLPLPEEFCGATKDSAGLPKLLRDAPKLCEALENSVERCQALGVIGEGCPMT